MVRILKNTNEQNEDAKKNRMDPSDTRDVYTCDGNLDVAHGDDHSR